MIKFSAPGKIHLLGEHTVVYGKPALLAAIDLRVLVTIGKTNTSYPILRKVVDEIIKKRFKKKIPDYSIESDLPVGSGLGFSASASAACFAALLSFLKLKWDLDLINKLTYEAEKVFHGNPSGADQATVIFGGFVWFRKETSDLKLIQQLPFSIPNKLAKNFVLINTGQPKETTKEMIENAKIRIKKILVNQEQLTKDLSEAIQNVNEKEIIKIIKSGEKNLESIGVVSKDTLKIIREIEKLGGGAKISGAGGKKEHSGVILGYHSTPSLLIQVAKSNHLDYFRVALGVAGLRKET